MGDLSDFEREQIVGTRLAGASVTKLSYYQVYRERQFLRLCRHTRIMGKQHQRRGTVGRITAREYVDRLGNQVHPMIQTFPNNDAVCQDDSAPFTQLELFCHGWKGMGVNLNIFPCQHNRQI
jgi:hypothetical protein